MRRTTGLTLLVFLAVIAVLGFGVYKGIEVAERKALADRAAAEPWRQSPDWRGTELAAKLPAPPQVIQAFANDPPAPEGRREVFARFLPGSAYWCIGWYGSIDSVTPNDGGWEATVKIGCRLKGRGGVPFCPAASKETWQISKSGAARCIKCDGSVGLLALMVD